MKSSLVVASLTFVLASGLAANAQQEGGVPTQALVSVDGKGAPPASASDLTVTVNNHKQPLSAWTPVVPANAQVALLIDDGLRESVGRELNNMRTFIQGLSPGIEIMVGYLQNGRVVQAQPFTADHGLAASALRLPQGIPGTSASPYFCLSDFVKKWPETGQADPNALSTVRGAGQKARFVLMITNGVDPYNGGTGVMNQDSPYVQTAIDDSQRAGVAVYSIYYTDAGIRGASASLSGQSYLQQLADETGGYDYYEGTGNPVSMAPFLNKFQSAIAATYIATFEAPAGRESGKDLVRVKFTATTKTKLRAPQQVRAGNVE